MVSLNPRQRIIVLIFKIEDKNNPSDYRTIVISPLLVKLYGIGLERNIDIWPESHRKIAKCQARFQGYHSTMDQLVTLRIIFKEHFNNKTNIL